MNMMSRDIAGGQPGVESVDSEDTIRFTADSGATVTIALDEIRPPASREEVLVKAKEAIRQLAAAFDEADAARKRKADARRVLESDPGALFRSWAHR